MGDATRRDALKIAVAVGTAGIVASEGSAEAAAESKVAVRTVYLRKPIRNYRRITLEGELEGEAKLTLDPSICTVNEFGNTEKCEEAQMDVCDVTLKFVKEDEFGVWRLYVIEGTTLDNPLYLVVAKGQAGYRLVYDDRDSDGPYPVTVESGLVQS